MTDEYEEQRAFNLAHFEDLMRRNPERPSAPARKPYAFLRSTAEAEEKPKPNMVKSSNQYFMLPYVKVSVKPKFSSIVRKRSAPRNGSARFPWKLKISLLTSRKKSDGKCRGV